MSRLSKLTRHLLPLCAILSLALCVAVCVLWVRSRSGWDRAQWSYCRLLPDRSIRNDELDLASSRSGVELTLMHGHAPRGVGYLVRGYDINAAESNGRPRFSSTHDGYYGFDDMMSNFQSTGFRSPIRFDTFARHTPTDIDDAHIVSVAISHWLLALLLLLPPALWLKHLRRARRLGRIGLCPQCGYDLRATPERCPECGRSAVQSSTPASNS